MPANSSGGPTAKLVARKSKGMPRISIDLQKLSGSSSSDVMGNLSLTLYRDLKEKRAGLTKGCGVSFLFEWRTLIFH